MTLQLKVPSIVCEGCADTITEAIQSLDSSSKVNVNIETKDVSAETSAAESAIREAIAAKGHTVE
ncbi:copper chaperone [filamentous cyanobacterium CCP5]|nr:copper chaperone [filamentous cyanobacterium CCP5]